MTTAQEPKSFNRYAYVGRYKNVEGFEKAGGIKRHVHRLDDRRYWSYCRIRTRYKGTATEVARSDHVDRLYIGWPRNNLSRKMDVVAFLVFVGSLSSRPPVRHVDDFQQDLSGFQGYWHSLCDSTCSNRTNLLAENYATMEHAKQERMT
jgi:hypothetical protein